MNAPFTELGGFLIRDATRDIFKQGLCMLIQVTADMRTIKQEIISLLEALPEDIDFEDAIETISAHQKYLEDCKGSQIESNYLHEKAMAILDNQMDSEG